MTMTPLNATSPECAAPKGGNPFWCTTHRREHEGPITPPQQENPMTTTTTTVLATRARALAVLLTETTLPMPHTADVTDHSGIDLMFNTLDDFTAWCDHLGLTPTVEQYDEGKSSAVHSASCEYEGHPLRLVRVVLR